VAPIALPSADEEVPVGQNCTITGWGIIDEHDYDYYYGSNFSSILQKAKVPVIDNLYCRELYKRERLFYKIFPDQLCAGFEKEGAADTCDGESGGPLACNSSTGISVLQEIVSFGGDAAEVTCARANQPGVYTRVASFVTWIKKSTSIAIIKLIIFLINAKTLSNRGRRPFLM